MNILTIAAAAVGLYLLAGSKKNETKKSDGLIIKGDVVPPEDKPSGGILGGSGQFKEPKLPIIPKKVGGISILGCTVTQFEKDGKCVTFWDDNTEKQVVARIMKKAQEWYDSVKNGPVHPENEVGHGYITALCSDETDGKGNFETNKQALKIIIETITELWPVVTKDALPPKPNSATWLIEIWNRVVKIYYKEICGL